MRTWIAILGLTWAVTAVAQDLSGEQQARYDQTIRELRCLVCQNQSIADSNAPLAEDLRHQVRQQISEGRSDQDIRDYLTARYGEYVLYRPPLSKRTALLWLGPGLLVLAGLAFVLTYLRRSARNAAPESADPDALRRLLDEEP